ncbi:MAG: DUF2490 domain-containing protein [Bacteroidota bacterium]
MYKLVDPLIRLILTFVLAPNILFAQQKSIAYDNQQWLQYYQTLQVSNRISILNDVGYRVKDVLQRRSQYLVRTMVSWQVGKEAKVGVGIGHWGSFRTKGLGRIEIRPHLNFSTRHQQGKWVFSHRLRGEQRFFQSVNPSGDHVSNIRIRYRLIGKFPLVQFLDSSPISGLDMLLGNEVMLNLGESIAYNVFDQNRVLAGTLLKVSPALHISLLYQHRFQALNQPAAYRQLYILWLGI